jgi:PPM family protein phosphatase
MASSLHAIVLEPAESLLQDRARTIEVGDALVIAVADGAGGISGSERAAGSIVQGLESWVERGLPLDQEPTWTAFLRETDATIHRAGNWGETTAVVLAVTGKWICGASVGDSEAWMVTADDFVSLTRGQVRKPFLGCGAARIVPFRRRHAGGTLIVGTDGLFKYAPAWKICETAREEMPDLAAQAILELVRLPGGRLQDDVGFVVARIHAGP